VGRLTGKTIIVTGSASGIGAGISRGMAAEGGNLVIADLDGEQAEKVATAIRNEGGQAVAAEVDVTSPEQVAAGIKLAVDTFGHLDAYFNNAGLNAAEPLLDVTKKKWDLIFNVNAYGVMVGTQEAAKQFIAQGSGGKIVNTASIAGRQGFPDFAPYSASKAAVISLTQAAARAFAPNGITVNAFAPGVVDTPLWIGLDKDLADMGRADAGFEAMSGDILLGRPAQPEDLIPTAVFLAASDSDYITGQVIPIEGGMILV
jgi:meso-butanediol dehydrogenase / (S,S)-butanediol dehydrogenase / diacetyl reductase